MGVRAVLTAVLMIAAAAGAGAQCVSEARVISSRSSVPNLVSGPAAFGSGVLAVAKTNRATDEIFVAAYDQNFNTLRGDTLVAAESVDGPLALVWNGSGFGLFYRTDSPDRLVLQRLAENGEAIGTPIPVSSREFESDDEMAVAWSDTLGAYAVASTFMPRTQRDVWITVMDRDGIVRRDVSTSVFASTAGASLDIAVTADGTIGVFYLAVDESVAFAPVTSSAAFFVTNIWPAGHDLRVAALGNRFYLVKQVRGVTQTEIRMLGIDTVGTVVVSDRSLVGPATTELRPTGLMTNGQELALSYIDVDDFSGLATYHLRRVTPAGSLLADSLFAAAHPAQRFAWGEHDAVWAGASYVSTAVREVGRDLDSVLVRLCPLGARIETERSYVYRNEYATFTAVPEGGVPEYEYQWTSGESSKIYEGPTFRYRWDDTGTYTVTLTVTDHAGVSTTTTYTIRVVEKKRRAVRN